MSVNAGCGGYRPVRDFDPGGPPQAVPLPAGTPLTRLWRSRPLRGPTAPVAADGTTLYVGGADRRVLAVDLGGGRTRWAHRVSGPLAGGVVLGDGIVYAATDRPEGRVHAFQGLSGNELWSTGTGYVEAPLALLPDRIIVLNRKGQMLALDRRDGRVLWRRRLPSQRLGPHLLPSGQLLVTSHDSLYLVRPEDGAVTVRRPTPGAITAPWVNLGPDLVAGTGDSSVVAIRPGDLSVRWSAPLDAPVLAPPAVTGDTVYAVTLRGTIFRLIATEPVEVRELGSDPWAATGAPVIFSPWLMVGASDGSLKAFRLEDGQPAWNVPLGRPLELAPLVLGDDGFVALGGEGDLHRIVR